MKKYSYIGKTKEEALNKAMYELNCNENDLIITEKEQKSGLFKSKKIELEIIKNQDIIDYIKTTLKNITNKIGLNVNLEIKLRENTPLITMFSDNNNILIGKEGRTLNSLSTIIKQSIQTEFDINYKFQLDVGEYKEKKQRNIEYMAKKVAKEVQKTKIAAKLDPMNSYERRLVHSALSTFKNIKTESEGEEPNRYVVIKPEEE